MPPVLRTPTLILVVLGLGGCVAGCPTDSVCEPGETQDCVCTDGRDGAQSCAEDGESWGECACTGDDDTTGDDD